MHRIAAAAAAVVLYLIWIPVLPAEEAAQKPPKEAKPHRPDVVFVPTPQKVVEKMLELAKVKKTDLLYDLGCGDGRIVVTAAKKYGCKAVGFDVDPQRIKECKQRVKENKVEKLVKIEQKNIFKLDLSKANVITLYLLPSLNVKLIPQLEKLKPGCRIVSHDFDMRGVKPDLVLRDYKCLNDDGKTEGTHTLYLWTTPLKKEKGDKKYVKSISLTDASLPTSAQLTSKLQIVVQQAVRPKHANARYATVKSLPDGTYEDWGMTKGSVFSETVKRLEQPPGTVLLEIMAVIRNEGDKKDEVRIRGFELVFDKMSTKPCELLPGNVFGTYDRMAKRLSLSDKPPSGELLVMINFEGGLICSLDPGKRTFIATIFAVPKDLERATLKIKGDDNLIAQVEVPTK